MWEVYPDYLDPYFVVKSAQPVYTEELTGTSLNYTVMNPLLISGRTYAWRVRVTDPEGITAFKNDGYSDVSWFKYGLSCTPPELELESAGTEHINVAWNTEQLQSNFTLRYRPSNQETVKWYSANTTFLSHKIEPLRSNTEYIVEVEGNCGTQPSGYSNALTVTTNRKLDYQCGKDGSIPAIENQERLTRLVKGNYITVGDFEVEIHSVEGRNGVFNGKGFVLVPLFNFLKLEADLEDIVVNTDFQLIGGEIKTVYNLNNSLTLNLSELFDGDGGTPEENDFKEIADIKVETGDSILSVEVINGQVTVTTTNGSQTETVGDKQIVSVTRPGGEQYVVDGSTGTVYTQGSASGSAPVDKTTKLQKETDEGAKYKVSFSAVENQFYGFDKPGSDTPSANYDELDFSGQKYLIPWKSVEANKFDKLTATIVGTPADSVFYSRESASMVMVAPTMESNTKQLMISGQGNKDTDELYAYYTEKGADSSKADITYHAASVNLISYEKQTIKLCLVGVNGSVVPDAAYIQTYLNSIYKQAVVDWEVVGLEGGITVTLDRANQKMLDNTDADNRMDYTDEMKQVIAQMKTNTAYKNDFVYLFFFDEAVDAKIAGYMPLKGQFGFIFKFKSYPDTYERTIAHEVAHGAFRLRHTFSSENTYIQNKGATTNLMDYSGPKATGLYKYQWDNIHDPETMLFAWLEEEGEGEKRRIPNYIELNWMLAESGGFSETQFRELFINGLSNELDKSICFISSGSPNMYDFTEDDGNNLYFHYRDYFENKGYDIIILFSRTQIMLLSEKDKDLENYIRDWWMSENVYYSFIKNMPSNERNSNFCLIRELFLKVGEYYNATNFLNNYKSCFTLFQKSEDQSIEEHQSIDLEITNVRSYIDLTGNVKVAWKTNSTQSYFMYKFNGEWKFETPVKENNNYVVNIARPRNVETSYRITLPVKEGENEKFVSSSTGNFQGNDNNNLCKVYGPIGKEGDALTYYYKWVNESDEIPEEFGEQYTKPQFYFLYKERKIYKIIRTHVNEDIVDEAIVLIDPQDNCEFELTSLDNTPPKGIPRVNRDPNGFLEVVIDDSPEIKMEFEKNNPDQPYGKGYPLWYIDSKKIQSEGESCIVDLNTVGDYKVEASAYDINKALKVKTYELNEKPISVGEIQDPLINNFDLISQICGKMDQLNQMLKTVDGFFDPIRKYTKTDIPQFEAPVICHEAIYVLREYNAEVYGKPNVVKDFDGEINFGISTKEFDFSLGKVVTLGIQFDFSPITIAYDARKRIDNISTLSLDGGTGTGTISLCLGPDLIIGSVEGCVSIPLYATVRPSNLLSCDYEIAFGYGDIKLYLTAKAAGTSTDVELINIPGGETEPICIIYK